MNDRKANLENVIYFQLEQTVRKSKLHSQKAFQRAGIDVTVDQWVLLMQINQNEGISQNELAAKALKDAASVTRMLDILQNKGLLLRKASEEDRRKFQVSLTEEGRSLIAKHIDLVVELRTAAVAGFSADELEQLKAMLNRIQANLS